MALCYQRQKRPFSRTAPRDTEDGPTPILTKSQQISVYKPGQHRLCWVRQKDAEKEPCIRRLKASETEHIPLAKLAPIALESNRRDLTNRVGRGSVW
jgi:hypothetical protein